MKILRWNVILVILLLSACGFMQSTEEKLTEAENLLQSREYNSAIVILKDVLQDEKANTKARFLLGRLYQEIGDYEGAIKELEIAFKQGWRENNITYLWLTSLREGGNNKVLAEKLNSQEVIQNLTDEEKRVFHAWLNLSNGAIDQAQDEMQSVLDSAPDNFDAVLGLAKINILRGDTQAALQLLEDKFNNKEMPQEAVILYGDLLFQLNRRADAEKQLKAALAHEPADVLTRRGLYVRLGLIRVLLAEKRFEEASTIIGRTYKQAPNHGLVAYYKGFDEYRKKNYAVARETLNKVINSIPGHKPSLLLLGTINYIEKNYEQAGFFLERYLEDEPDNQQARKMLGASQLKLNQASSALEALKPILDSGDADVLRMAGAASIAMGKKSSGIDYFKSVVDSNPEDVDVRVELAKAYLTTGALNNAKKELEKTIKTGKSSEQAFSLLLNLHLREGNMELAEALAAKGAGDHPEAAFYQNVYGQVLAMQKKWKEAERQFQTATKVDNQFWPAQLNMAKVYMATGRDGEAENHFSMLAEDHLNPVVATDYVRFLLSTNANDKAIAFIKTLPFEPSYLRLHAVLLGLYDKTDNQKEYAKHLDQLEESRAGRTLAQSVRGKSSLKKGNVTEAITIYKTVVNENPESPAAYLELAKAYSVNGEIGAAKESLRKALTLNKNYVAAISALTNLYVNDNQVDKGKALIADFIKRNPESAIGYEMRGDFLVRQGKTIDAIKAYEYANKLDTKRYQPTIKIARLYVKNKQYNSAFKKLNQALSNADGDALFYLGLQKVRLYESQKDDSKAASTLKSLASRLQGNSAKLNDLAWLLYKYDKKEAYKYAKKAAQDLPGSAAVNDTFGWISLKNGNKDEAMQYLEKAHRLAPDVAEIEFHYAVALYEKGEQDQSRQIMERLQSSSEKFPGKEQIATYLK